MKNLISEKFSTDTYGKVAVLMGGLSAERDISLKSGNAVLAALKNSGINAVGVDVDENVLSTLIEGGFDRAFIALHGRGGEDGVMQGALEILDLPYTGSGVPGSVIGMDKLRTKQIWTAENIPTPAYKLVCNENDLLNIETDIGFPVMVKPVHEGSSIGMARADDMNALYKAWSTAFTYDQQVLIEKWVEGIEYTAAILGNEVLPLIKLETARDFYDYTAKYIADDTQYICPCGLEQKIELQLSAQCLSAFNSIDASGWGRVDFMCDENGDAYMIEVNTVPGMTDHSLVPMAAKQKGLSFEQLVIGILNTSMYTEKYVSSKNRQVCF